MVAGFSAHMLIGWFTSTNISGRKRRSGNEERRCLGNSKLERCPGNQGILSSCSVENGQRSGCKHYGPLYSKKQDNYHKQKYKVVKNPANNMIVLYCLMEYNKPNRVIPEPQTYRSYQQSASKIMTLNSGRS